MTTKIFPTLTPAAVLFAAMPALAEPISDPGAWRPDEIVVEGRRLPAYRTEDASVVRIPVPVQDIPQQIQTLTPTLLREQELRTLSDALRNISGAIPNAPSETVLANPILRGFEAEIYVDGLIGYGDTAVIDPSSLAGVERIEVAKGPTSLLFGGGTGAPTGGLINIVTKTPEPESFARIGLRGGSFSTIAPMVDLNASLGDRAGFRVAGEYSVSDDYIDAVEIERIVVNPSFSAELTPNTRFLLRGGYNRIEQLEYAGLPAEVARLPGVDRFQFSGASDAPDTVVENWSVHASLTHQIGERLKLNLQARRFENQFDEFGSTPFLAFFPLAGTSAPIIKARLPVETGQWTIDANLAAELPALGADHVLFAGMTYDRTDYDAAIGFDFTPIGVLDYENPAPLAFGAGPTLSTFLANDYRSAAFYFQDHAKIGDRLNLLGGVRLTRYRLIEQQGGVGADETYTRADPRFGAAFEIGEGVSLFAGYATGSRLTLFFNGGATPPKLETSKTVDGGVKFSASSIGLSGTLAGFWSRRENVPTPDPTTFVTSIQTGEQRSKGAEIDLIYEPNRNLSVLLSAAYTDAQVTRDTQIPAGTALPRVPKTSGRAAVRYRFDQGALNGLGLGAGLAYAQEAALAFPSPFAPNFPAVFDSDAFLIADLQASYEVNNYRISVSIQNLFNNDYLLPYQYLGQEVVRPGEPRSVFASLSAQF